MSDVIAPFDEGKQKLLKLVDGACQAQAKAVKEEAARRQLAGESLAMDPETAAWINIITAYGLLFNRAIEAGWIEDVILTDSEAANDEKCIR